MFQVHVWCSCIFGVMIKPDEYLLRVVGWPHRKVHMKLKKHAFRLHEACKACHFKKEKTLPTPVLLGNCDDVIRRMATATLKLGFPRLTAGLKTWYLMINLCQHHVTCVYPCSSWNSAAGSLVAQESVYSRLIPQQWSWRIVCVASILLVVFLGTVASWAAAMAHDCFYMFMTYAYDGLCDHL